MSWVSSRHLEMGPTACEGEAVQCIAEGGDGGHEKPFAADGVRAVGILITYDPGPKRESGQLKTQE